MRDRGAPVSVAFLLALALAAATTAEVRDLRTRQDEAIVYGASSSDGIGRIATATGDLNADGVADLILGSPLADGPNGSRPNSGEVYVLFGPFTPLIDLNLATFSPDVIIYQGASPGVRYFGELVAAADLNGDLVDDLVVADPRDNGPAGTRIAAGSVSVFFGPMTASQIIDLDLTSPDLRIHGESAADFLGTALVLADVSGDGLADLIADTPWDYTPIQAAGRVHAFFNPVQSGTVDLAVSGGDLVISGGRGNGNMGRGLAVAELSGDTANDIALSQCADGPNSTGGCDSQTGEVLVVFGPFASGASIDLRFDSPDATVHGIDPGDELGWRLAAGDVNRDGNADLVMAAAFADGPGNTRSDAGEAYVQFGPFPSGFVLDLATTPADVTIYGADDVDNLGYTVMVADVTNDGVSDLIIGAWRADGEANARQDAGETSVFFGPVPTGVIDLGVDSPDLRVIGETSFDRLSSGHAVADLTDDGIDDFALGAAFGGSLAPGTGNAGRVYILIGPAGSSTTCLLLPDAVTHVLAVRRNDDIDFSWDPAADIVTDHYNLYTVSDGDKTLIPFANSAGQQVYPSITSPASCQSIPLANPACTLLGAISSAPDLVYYQVRAACADGSEGT